jgi:hypothetical protein
MNKETAGTSMKETVKFIKENPRFSATLGIVGIDGPVIIINNFLRGPDSVAATGIIGGIIGIIAVNCVPNFKNH